MSEIRPPASKGRRGGGETAEDPRQMSQDKHGTAEWSGHGCALLLPPPDQVLPSPLPLCPVPSFQVWLEGYGGGRVTL